ncbi:MAG: Fur family transcriptional regulator [Magnetospiraceae bacterium]
MKVSDQEIENRLSHFREKAQQAGVKLTHQRLEILRAVASSLEHPTAETVYRAVRGGMPTVSLDTVYRTLWLLTDLGLLRTLGQRQDGVRFDANVAQHHHYRCINCGMVRDFESADLNALPIPEAVRDFGDVVGTQIEVQGICTACQEAAADQDPTLQ